MQLAKDDRPKMKKVIFTLVCTASLFFGAVCANSDAKECICFPDLKTITCSQNGFYQRWPDIAALENCTGEYTSIDLSHNKFDEYPTESKGYEFVNISNNYLKKFRPSPLETKILDVSSNIIDDMSLKPCSKLEKLYAANNSLNENNFECGSCGQLLVLDLSHNKFKGFGSITNCEKLLALDMSYNTINSIPQDFYSLKSLKNVSFFNNELKFLNDLPGSVVRLNISKNKLTEVKKPYFIDLKALEILDLSDNSISTVHDNAFAELPALEMIDLSNNKLMTLPLLELCENVRNVMLLKNKITDMNGTVVMHLLNSTDREVDVRDNPIRVVSKRQFVLYLDNSGAHIVWYKNCTCFDVSRGNATLKFCAEEEGEVEEDECWVTIARMSSTSTISTTTTSTEESFVARITERNATRAEGVNESAAGAGAGAGAGADSTGDAAAVEQAAFLGLSGSKLSFLGFLLLTFLALLVANCVAGHPVVDERWWEETLRGDRVVS